MPEVDDLLASIFEGANRALHADFEKWVRGSKRFRAFATAYRTKIRAKIRNVPDPEGMKDLRAELEAAVILLREERFTLEYEKYAAAKQRGPDFTVTFKTHTPFNVEVRRAHSAELVARNAEAHALKLVAVLCDKMRQMPPSIVNFLWLVAEGDVSEAELTAATTAIRQMIEGKVEPFFTYFDYPSAAEFLKQYQRLNGVVLRDATKYALWLNPFARHKPPPDLILAFRRITGPSP